MHKQPISWPLCAPVASVQAPSARSSPQDDRFRFSYFAALRLPHPTPLPAARTAHRGAAVAALRPARRAAGDALRDGARGLRRQPERRAHRPARWHRQEIRSRRDRESCAKKQPRHVTPIEVCLRWGPALPSCAKRACDTRLHPVCHATHLPLTSATRAATDLARSSRAWGSGVGGSGGRGRGLVGRVGTLDGEWGAQQGQVDAVHSATANGHDAPVLDLQACRATLTSYPSLCPC